MEGIEKSNPVFKRCRNLLSGNCGRRSAQRVRPFGTAHIFEGKLYIQTGKKKEVSKQLKANPKAEICAFKGGKMDSRCRRAD